MPIYWLLAIPLLGDRIRWLTRSRHVSFIAHYRPIYIIVAGLYLLVLLDLYVFLQIRAQIAEPQYQFWNTLC